MVFPAYGKASLSGAVALPTVIPMLTAEQNDELTEVGPGTRMGDVLRRYWYPVAFARELAEFPVKRVELLGEFFALWRQPSGRYGIVPEPCPHRKASMAYGVVEADGLRCPYHGWKFDTEGACIEQPAERDNTNFADRVRARRGKGGGAGRPDLGVRRSGPGAAAAAFRHLRHGRLPRHRLGRPAVQLRPDHGERGRPAPRRVAARALLRVHGPPRGLHCARVVRQGAHQDRVHAVRVGDHQATRAQGRHRGERRLEGRPPARVPVQHAGGRRRGAPDADPGADQPDDHPVHALHGAQPRRLRARRPAADPRLPDPGARSSTAATSPTTSRARTSWPG